MKQNNPTDLLGYPTFESESQNGSVDTSRPQIGSPCRAPKEAPIESPKGVADAREGIRILG